MILNVFLAQVSTTDRILQTPIIGDVFYVFTAFTSGLLALTIAVLVIESIAHYFLKKYILFTDNRTDISAYEALTNSYTTSIWWGLLIAINALGAKYSFENSEGLAFIFLLWIVGLIPGFIAYKKGRNFLNWWMYGHLLFIVAFPHALLLRETENSLINRGILKNCPYCAEVVKKEAKVCKHCGNQLN
jgi:hypothetical protein